MVARRAVDVEALLAAQNQVLGYRHRKEVRQFAVLALAGVEQRVVIEVAARHCAFDEGAGGAAVGEEIAGPQWDVLRLVMHVLAAGREQGQRYQENGGAGNLACSRLFRRLFAPVRESSST